MLPGSAVERAGDNAIVWRVKDGRVNKIAVQLGERDERSGDVSVKAGVAVGDQLLRRPGTTLKDGQGVEWAKPAAASGALLTMAPAAPAAPAASASK